jgi:hypothetical protein
MLWVPWTHGRENISYNPSIAADQSSEKWDYLISQVIISAKSLCSIYKTMFNAGLFLEECPEQRRRLLLAIFAN